MQRPRQHAVAQRHHHLDHSRDPGRGAGVADVRLDRPQPQRALGGVPARRSPAAPAPRSDRRASCRCRGPRPRRPAAGESRALASACAITRCWEGPFGAVSPLLAPSWLTALPRTSASTSWPLRCASERRSSTQHPRTLAPADAVGGIGEGLAAPVRARPRWRAELDEQPAAWPSPSRRPPAPASTRRRAAPRTPGAAPPARRSRPCRPTPPGPPARSA